MNTINIKNIEIGKGKPKICIPIMGKTKDELIEEVTSLQEYPCDIVEWRIDYFEAVFVLDILLDTLTSIYELMDDKLLLITFRTSNEGGEKDIDPRTYVSLLETIIHSQKLDLIDLECCFHEEAVLDLTKVAHEYNIVVVMSHHNFNKTLSNDELLEKVKEMEVKNADIIKLAMMPNSKEDVINLLNFTLEVSKELNKPLITMSMGALGSFSRLSGELYGSSVSFACMDKKSAPGQINAKELDKILNLMHNQVD